VTTSSLPQIYSTTLDSSSFTNLHTIQIQALTTADIVTLGGSGGSGSYSYTIGTGGTGSTVTINGSAGGGGGYGHIWKSPEEWVDQFPNWDRIQKMCKTYPGLEIAFEKFKTTYYLVKDDYDSPKEK
jgi:hypothetical protein